MMRCLKRNKQKMWFADYLGVTEHINSDGYYDGDDKVNYSEPKETYVNISSATGISDSELFGADLKYDKVLAYDAFSNAVSINEYSILWVDTEPYKNGVLQPHDYKVVRVAASHDKTAYLVAIERVNRNENY